MNKKLISGITIAGILAGGLSGYYMAPVHTVEVEKIVNETVYIDVPVELIVEKVVEVPVNVTEVVEVDNGNLELVLDHIFDNDGNINYLTDDLDDDEVEQIVDRVVFMNEVKKMAVDAVKKDLFDELDGETVNAVELDEDDMERLRIDDEDDEITVDSVDFDDGDAEVIVTGSFEQDDVKYLFDVVVKFRDGEYDELENINISLN